MIRMNSSRASRSYLVVLALLAIPLGGCQKSEYKMATASGTCTCKGQPMTAGLLVFTPLRDRQTHGNKLEIGKPAHGMIQPDGTFTLSTYGEKDGAVIGKHQVVLNLGVLEDDDPKPPCKIAHKDLVVEIVPGNNTLSIELAGNDSKK